ncbi:MAG: AbrB/MazE/SpoVT family DNA-binding domain-containing protein [Proteobacteria bacterium]|nr:AbrB/MazE/SpoVT family DNA-binding domain-containing protein [Pseudomonadota bacterium]
MKVTSKGQVTIPRDVRAAMGILPAETEVEFVKGENNNWYLKKVSGKSRELSRFRKAAKIGKLRMSTDEIMALTREA